MAFQKYNVEIIIWYLNGSYNWLGTQITWGNKK